MSGSIGHRKRDHIRVCLADDSQFLNSAGFDGVRLEHNALPDMDVQDVDLSVEFMGTKLNAPLLVASMSGGPIEGARINENVARAAEATRVAMGVGSQRIAFEHPETAATFQVRKWAPTIPVFANFGAVQLNYGFGLAEAQAAVDMIGADGLFLHLNALQEVVQDGGNTNFRGLLERIRELIKGVSFPVLVKECGSGISGSILKALWDAGAAAIDVSGAGGTSWAKVEGERAADPSRRALAETFGEWGIPTAVAVQEGRAAAPDAVIIASGGIRSGLDAAKAIALGADIVSVAQPVLASALDSSAAVESFLTRFMSELRVACFLVGARTIDDLRHARVTRYSRDAH